MPVAFYTLQHAADILTPSLAERSGYPYVVIFQPSYGVILSPTAAGTRRFGDLPLVHVGRVCLGLSSSISPEALITQNVPPTVAVDKRPAP